MKILFLNYEYPPLGGGAGNATQYILREFAQHGDVEVHLVASGIGKKKIVQHLGGKVWVHFLPIGKNANNLHVQSQRDVLTYSRRAWGYAGHLVAQARAKQVPFESTIAFFGVPCGVLALWLRFRYGVPYLVSLRGSDVPGYSEKFDRIYWLLKPMITFVWKHAKAVVPNSQGLLELAKKTAPKQAMTIIPNGVDTDEFHENLDREPDGTLRILAVGRLTPRKGIRFLIRAMKILQERFPTLQLTLIGDGEERTSLEALAKECRVEHMVQFVGLVEHANLPPYYAAADVFCLPSLNEGMSNTVLEALAAGLPIVATVTGGTEELVVDGENGFFVKQQSPEDLADKLTTILSDAEKRKHMGAASRRRALSMNWRSVAEQFLNLVR